MEPLEGLEDLGLILACDSDSVISAGKQPFPGQFLSRDVNLRAGLTPVMDGVPDQVLEDLNEAGSIDMKAW